MTTAPATSFFEGAQHQQLVVRVIFGEQEHLLSHASSIPPR